MASAVSFVMANLAVDSASFRQHMLADLRTMLLRCRDSLVLQVRRKGRLEGASEAVARQLDDLVEAVFANCFPGANYQRLTTCLQVNYIP